MAAARALGVMGAGASETRLVAALDRDVPGLRPEIAEALDRSGTVDTVLAPREAAARYREGEFPRLARNAIAAIQARAAGAEHGQVSVAQPALEEGRLSLPADEAGRLSVPVDAACRLSEPGRRTRG